MPLSYERPDRTAAGHWGARIAIDRPSRRGHPLRASGFAPAPGPRRWQRRSLRNARLDVEAPSPRPSARFVATPPSSDPASSGPGHDVAITPGGRFLAYESNESGRYEVYVRPFPEVDAGRWQVSRDGGGRSGGESGRELFYMTPPDGSWPFPSRPSRASRSETRRSSSRRATSPVLRTGGPTTSLPTGQVPLRDELQVETVSFESASMGRGPNAVEAAQLPPESHLIGRGVLHESGSAQFGERLSREVELRVAEERREAHRGASGRDVRRQLERSDDAGAVHPSRGVPPPTGGSSPFRCG